MDEKHDELGKKQNWNKWKIVTFQILGVRQKMDETHKFERH